MSKKLLVVTLISLLCLTLIAGCASPKNTATAAPEQASPAAEATKAADGTTPEATDAANAGEGALDPYTFTLYFSYDWWTIRPWAQDESSKFLAEKFNITPVFSKPDADAPAKLNVMVSSGDLPDVIHMDRNQDNERIAKLGMFLDLAPLQAANPSYDESVSAATQDMLKVDGVLYRVPHWSRKNPTGGNDSWIYNKTLYDSVGSPSLATFEDLYAYAKLVKEQTPKTEDGQPVIPFATQNANDAFDKITSAFYRSMGGPNKAATYTARIDGKIQSVLRDPLFRQATLEANKWFREGLISETQFTDTNDQMVEKFAAGRTALMYYDFSQESVNHFRTIMRETYPTNDYILLTDPVYPPASANKVYADHKESTGGSVLCLTTSIEQPQRAFDLFAYMLTKEGSINMMYGPQGDLWDELDASGNPILKTPEASWDSATMDRVGTWFWSFCSQSDNVDSTKFAVNAMQPEADRDWVISMQADVLTPIMFMSDEYIGLNTSVDSLSDLGIQRTLCEEQYKAELPKIIMATSAEQAEKLYDALLAFFDQNGFAEVEAAYDVRHQENVKIQGFTAFDK